MTKKILFLVERLGCGGINRSLENLLSILPDKNLDIIVMALDGTGQYQHGFPNSKLFKANFILDRMTRYIGYEHGLNKYITGGLKLINRLSDRKIYSQLCRRLEHQIDRQHFDVLIAFGEGGPSKYISHITASKKIAWIHCDFKSYLSQSRYSAEEENATYDSFDNIVCVSEFTRRSFVQACPSNGHKAIRIYNALDIKKMTSMSIECIPEFSDGFNIVTIGRIDPIKRPSAVPSVLSKILSAGKNVHWYIIGPPAVQSEVDRLNSEIKKYGIAANIHVFGERKNPYPYIKNADLLVNTSSSEACPYVINEAKILGTPVVCTDFGSASEFVNNGINGFIAPLDKLADTIIRVIEDQTLYSRLKKNLADFNFDNGIIKQEFLKLIDIDK